MHCCTVAEAVMDKQTTLRVFSYNIRHAEGVDTRIDLERIAEVISQSDPDLVALQEVDKHCERSGDRDLAAELGRSLDMRHRFGKCMDYQGGEYGMAILSRLRIADTVRHPLPDGAEPRCALEVQVRAERTPFPISFVCIHNDAADSTIGVMQVKALLNALDRRTNPIILAGDFNAESTDRSMQLLREAQWNVLEKEGEPTWPADRPRREIDFIVLRNFPEIIIDHGVIDERVASDHRPVYATISFEAVSQGA